MLLVGTRLNKVNIIGLQTGSKLASTQSPVIDPANLKIVAYEVTGPMLTERPSILLTKDIREVSNIGIIIDSSDDIVSPEDIINVKKIINLGFDLIGMNVVDDNGHKLGKVVNYTIETVGFIIKQLNVKPSVIKSLSKSELLIHRSQIIEINNSEIIVKSSQVRIKDVEKIEHRLDYINPFRSSKPNAQPEN